MDGVTTGLLQPGSASAPAHDADSSRRAAARPCLHGNPPATPSTFFQQYPHLLRTIGAVFVFLAVSATIAHAWLLMRWDEPIMRYVEAHRSGALDTFFLTMSRFGSTAVVLSVGALLALVCWSRCRAVAIAIAVATLGRPVLEFLLKAVVARDRPNFARMVNGQGPSFPSGHVMAAVAIWGLLPLVVGLFTRSRVLWWASVAVGGFLIVTIAASRVYLGVHWPSDVVAGVLVGAFFLLGVEAVMDHVHRVGGCALSTRRDERAALSLPHR
jgi:undecaprenyl-diphosphatase